MHLIRCIVGCYNVSENMHGVAWLHACNKIRCSPSQLFIFVLTHRIGIFTKKNSTNISNYHHFLI
jgi:hypothetical protein